MSVRTNTGARSQQRAEAALKAGKFVDEIVPMTTVMKVTDKNTAQVVDKEVTISADAGASVPATTRRSARSSRCSRAAPSPPETPRNSPMAPRRSWSWTPNSPKRGLKPLGAFRSFAVAGCEPDEMGIGPVFAIRSF